MLPPHNTWHPHSTIKTRPSTSSAWSICKLVSFFITYLPKTYAIHALFFLIWTFAQWIFPLPPLTLNGTKTSFLTLTKNFKILPMQHLRNTLTTQCYTPRSQVQPRSLRWESHTLSIHYSVQNLPYRGVLTKRRSESRSDNM